MPRRAWAFDAGRNPVQDDTDAVLDAFLRACDDRHLRVERLDHLLPRANAGGGGDAVRVYRVARDDRQGATPPG